MDGSDLDGLEGFSGQVLHAESVGYDDVRRVHNGMIDKRPSLIARCLSTADVRDAVNSGRERGLEIAVRGGGHNVAGRSATDGGLMIDLSLMKGIHVDVANATIRCQPGVLWKEFDRAAAAYGLATPGGQVSTTGVAGLTLGGGIGWLEGQYGLSADNLLAAEMVTAAGEIIVASADEGDDLLWGLRGGGGNFGVVTSFLFQAHPVTTVLGGLVVHGWESAAEAFDLYGEFMAGAADEARAFFGLLHAPDGSGAQVAAQALFHANSDPDKAEADLKQVRQARPPLLDTVERIPYPAMNMLLDDGFPAGIRSYWKSAFLDDLTRPVVEALIDAFERVPSGLSGIVIEPLHGATTRVAVDATAFPHRDAGHQVLIAAAWEHPADTQVNVAWAQETFEAIRPHVRDRRYSNYLSADDSGLGQEVYAGNYARLAQIKRRYDPDNLFHLNPNVQPA